MHADAAARAGAADAAAAAEDQARHGQGPAPAAGHADHDARRHRPAQQHPAPALRRAPVADHRRARHRPRRPRRRPERRHPARQPGAAADRQGAQHPRPAEQGAGRPRARLRHRRSRPLAASAPAGGRPVHAGQHGRRGDGRRRATRWSATSSSSRPSCASCRPRAASSATSPTRRRRCSRTSARRRPGINRFFQTLGPVLAAPRSRAFQTLGAGRRGRHARGEGAAARSTELLRTFAAQAKPAAANLGALHEQPEEHRRRRAPAGLHLLPGRPRSTASTPSATTCAPAWSSTLCSTYAVASGARLLGELQQRPRRASASSHARRRRRRPARCSARPPRCAASGRRRTQPTERGRRGHEHAGVAPARPSRRR